MIHTLFVSFADSLSLTRGHCGLDLEVPTASLLSEHNKNPLVLSRRAKGILDATPRKTKKKPHGVIRSIAEYIYSAI